MLRFLRISISTILGVLPFILFLLLAALMIFVLGEVRRLDLHYTRQKALQDNFQCIKSLEDEILSTRKNLEARLLQISEIREYADLVEFQKNYNEVNHKLMQEFLIEKEYERFRQKKAGIVPPIQIYPYKQRQTPFLETLSSLNDLFTTSPKIREHEKPKESTIFPKLAVSGVSLIVDKNRQTFRFSKNDWIKLSALAQERPYQIPKSSPKYGLLKGHSFQHRDFVVGMAGASDPYNRIVFSKFGEDDFTRLYTPPGEPVTQEEQRKILSREEMPMLWLNSYVWLNIMRFGPTSHPLHNILETDPEFQPLQNRGIFFKAFDLFLMWNVFPLDYFEGSKDGFDPLAPEQIIVSQIQQGRIARSSLIRHLLRVKPDFGFGIHYTDGQREHYSLERKALTTQELPLKSFRYWKEGQFVSANQAPRWFRDFTGGSNTSFRIPFHFEWRNKNRRYFGSSVLSPDLDSGRVILYQSIPEENELISPVEIMQWSRQEGGAARFLLGFKFRWTAVFCVLMISVIFFIFVMRRFLRRIRQALHDCLQRLMEPEHGLLKEPEEEFGLLAQKLFLFHRSLLVRKQDFYLSLGLQNIINLPDLQLGTYLEEFYYFSREMEPDLKWRLLKTGEETEENDLFLDLLPREQELVSQRLGLKIEAGRLCLRIEEGEFKKHTLLILQKYLKALVQKAVLTESELQAGKLKKDLELGRQIQENLSANWKENLHPRLYLSHLQRISSISSSDFMDFLVYEKFLHFYLVDLAKDGLGSVLLATYIKAFMDGTIVESMKPAEVLKRVNRFLWQEGFEDLLMTMFYGVIDLETGRLYFASAAHPSAYLLTQSKVVWIRPKDAPLGLFETTGIKNRALDLKSGDWIYISSNIAMENQSRILAWQNQIQNHLGQLSRKPEALPALQSIEEDSSSRVVNFMQFVLRWQ